MKPGTLCYVVGLRGTPDWNGRVVTAVQYLGTVFAQQHASQPHQVLVHNAWQVDAEWIPPPYKGACVLPRGNLQPIHDPDADIPELTEVVHEKALDPA